MDAYPEYNVLDDKHSWDSKTRGVIEERMNRVPAFTFFTIDEARVLEAAISRLLPQEREEPVPVASFIDEKLSRNITDGTRYEGMPPMRDLWKLFVATLNEEAQMRYEKYFGTLDSATKDVVLDAIAKGETHSLGWKKLPARLAFEHIVSTAAAFYYAHPFVWSEIGWGGPKYPEIYVRIRCGRKDLKEPGDVGNVSE